MANSIASQFEFQKVWEVYGKDSRHRKWKIFSTAWQRDANRIDWRKQKRNFFRPQKENGKRIEMKSSTWFNRTERFSFTRSVCYSLWLFGILHSLVVDGGGSGWRCTFDEKYSGLPTRFEWLLIESSDWIPNGAIREWRQLEQRIDDVIGGQAEKIGIFLFCWSSLRMLQCRFVFAFSLRLFAKGVLLVLVVEQLRLEWRLLSGHHLHEFIEINSSWTVSIDFIDHAIQIVIR